MSRFGEFQDGRHALVRFVRNAFVRLVPEHVYRIIRFRQINGRFPNLRHPTYYSDKLLHKSLHDRRKILTLFADKHRVRDYVRRQVGGDIIFPETYAVYENWQDITLNGLPPFFVMKPNHGSGWVKIVRETERPTLAMIQRTARDWLSRDYSTYTKEWYYRDIRPVILFEELLLDREEVPSQYRLHCINGKPLVIRVIPQSSSGRQTDIYDIGWTKLDAEFSGKKNAPGLADRPAGLERMVHIAERLSADTDHVRVDLYNIDGRIFFGELTSFPSNGCFRIQPEHFDWELGSRWQLPARYVD